MPNLVRRILGKLKHQPLDAASSDFDGASGIYAYRPLSDSGNIRLLTILMGEGPIYVSLTEATINRSTYDALSYTWDSPIQQGDNSVTDKAACFIYCNNNRHQVTENLYHALLQFRADKRKGPLWIDAVCINQGDSDERSTQVGMMGKIYMKSRSVIIWLGKEDSETEKAISLLTKFGNAVKNLGVEMESWTDFAFNSSQFYDLVGLEPFQTRDWEIVFHFFARRWFSRLWVLQEVVLGRPTNFIIGHHALDFGAVSLTVVFLYMSDWMPSLKAIMQDLATKNLDDFLTGPRDIGPSLLYNAYLLEDSKEDGPEDKKYGRLRTLHGATNPYERRYAYLADVILLSQKFDASDDRDRVFAPLSLASKFVPPKQRALNWITPDYKQSVTSVFTDVSSLLIKNLPLMSLLSMVEDSKERRLKELPSWVPDFSCRKIGGSLTHKSDYDIYAFEEDFEFPDGFDDRAQLLDQSSLRTVGVIRGSVNKVSKLIEEIMVHHDTDYFLEFVLELPEFSPDGDPDGQKRLEVLWRTLVGDATDHSRYGPAPIEMGESFYHFLCWQMAVLLLRSRENKVEDEVFWENHATYKKFALMERLPSRSEISRDADDLAQKLIEAEVPSAVHYFAGIKHDVWEIIHQMNGVSGRRCLLVTESGELGLGPPSTQSGDVVAFIRNTRVPFILRNAQAGRYTLVGEAYIHGFMHGEILDGDPPEFQDIILE